MHRVLTLLLTVLVALALAGPVAAGKPVRGCPNATFELMGYSAFRNLSLSVGVPAELMGPDHEAYWYDHFDKNGDGNMCVMDLPDTPGTAYGWVFNVVDNTANR